MNKMKKLLSVLLAVVLALSCMSVMASAAKTSYQSVENLTNLGAYSPYGQVTRLSTEERTSIVFDALDNLLAPMTGLNMGRLLNLNLLFTTLTLDVNLTSVDGICDTFDSIESLFTDTMFSIAKAILNFGDLEKLDVSTWDQTGMSRDGTAQFTILSEVLEALSAQDELIDAVISDGLDLGMIANFLGNVDLSGINDMIVDLPGAIKGMIFGLFERWDDTTDEITTLEAAKVGNGNVESTVTNFVKNLFTNDMSISTVKADAAGNIDTTKHNLPSGTSGYRVLYNKTTVGSDIVLTATSYATQKYVDAQAKLGNTVAVGDYYVSAKYVLEPETGTTDYIWHQVNIDENGEMKTLEDGTYEYTGGTTPNLKYYELNSKLLPSLTTTIDLENMSAAQLLYTFVPVVFNEMAPVVLNGSMKKILASFFGASFKYVGDVGSTAVDALADSTNAFFTEEQGKYLWEWSNYAVINGTHYYRFEDQIFVGNLDNTNNYFSIIDWGYEIPETGFMDEFVPTNGGSTSDTLLMNLNDFLIKVADTVLVDSATFTDKNGFESQFDLPDLTAGSNANLVANIKLLAQEIISLAPQHIFGSDFATNPRCYYNLLMSDNNQTILTGIAATVVDLLMPQMLLPSASDLMSQNTTVGAILAAVLRELATQLVPQNNYDALIYVDYGTTTDDNVKTFLKDKTNDYWLDVILTMGIDIGIEYLHNFADFYGDEAAIAPADGSLWRNNWTWAAGTAQSDLEGYWELMLYYIVNWALTDGSAGDQCFWSMGNVVSYTTGTTDPWVILGSIFKNLLPIDKVLNISTSDSLWLETLLRDNFILALVDLNWETVLNILVVPDGYLRTTNVLDQLASLLKTVVNNLFVELGAGATDAGSDSTKFELIPAAITDFDSLAQQANITTFVKYLVGAIYTAGVTNGGCATLFPFLNFLLGWKTDPQQIADPKIWAEFRDNNDYAFLWNETNNAVVAAGGAINGDGKNSTKIRVLNNSAGMLETHRGSSVTDHAYDINIKSVTSDASTNTLTFTYDNVVSPYETVDIVIGGTYNGEEAVTVTITYDYIGKDGQSVGGTQATSITFLISNQYEDANIDGRFDGDDDEDYAGINQYKRYQFTEDIYGTVTNFAPVIFATKSTTGGTASKSFGGITAPDKEEVKDTCGNVTSSTTYDMDVNAPAYFDFITDQTEAGWPDTKPAEGSISGKLYKAASGVTADTDFPYGAYVMGRVAVKYGSDSKVWQIDYIYYNDYDIDQVWAEFKDKGITANDVGTEGAAAYEAYNTALKKVAFLATYPMMTAQNGNTATDYVTYIMPQIEAAKKALIGEDVVAEDGTVTHTDGAWDVLQTYMAEADSAAGADAELPSYVQDLEAQLALDDGDGEKEINFQDYRLYEYFNYADLRTAHRNFVKTYYAPEIMDTYYILNSGIREAELNNVIAAEDNEFKAAGITASRLKNDAQAIADSITAREAWKQPVNSELLVDDMTARLKYYKSFLNGENVVAANKESTEKALVFLNKEIAYADAQGYVESEYTTASWKVYKDAYDKAAAVVAGTAEYADYNSTVFSAKFELMKAQKNLLKLKGEGGSLIEAGGTATLQANAEIAEEIFASLAAGDGVWAVSADYITKYIADNTVEATADTEGYVPTEADAKNAAYAELISTLGYYYVGEDGNTWNLYADSAYEYLDNDRPNRSSNQAKVNASNTALEAAIKNFEMAADPELILTDLGTGVSIIDTGIGTSSGEYVGLLYGVDTINGELLENYFTTDVGKVEFLENENGVQSTGSVVNLLDNSGSVVETYVFVYFGDVNGDGAVDITDSAAIEAHDQWVVNFDDDSAEYYAGDVNGDGTVDITDSAAVEAQDQWVAELESQAEIAAKVNAAY